MDHQTPEQGWRELQDHIDRFFDQVLRVEEEKAILVRSAAGQEAESGQPESPDPDRQGLDHAGEDWELDEVTFLPKEHPSPCSP